MIISKYEILSQKLFRPGGKYGDKPKSSGTGTSEASVSVSEAPPLQQAASVILSALPSEPSPGAPEAAPVPAVSLGALKSKLWTELL